MFYCQRISGDVNFSIDEWNEQFKLCIKLGIPFPDDPEPCENQCFECLEIVAKTREKNKLIFEKQKNDWIN